MVLTRSAGKILDLNIENEKLRGELNLANIEIEKYKTLASNTKQIEKLNECILNQTQLIDKLTKEILELKGRKQVNNTKILVDINKDTLELYNLLYK
jgi:hypothetical protein